MIVLLLIKPGNLRDGLNAILYTIPEVQFVAHSNNMDGALDFCMKYSPVLVILEVKPGDQNLLTKITEMKASNPQTQVIAIIHDEADREPAEQGGMDQIIEVGLPATKLKSNITQMVSTFPKTMPQSSERWLGRTSSTSMAVFERQNK